MRSSSLGPYGRLLMRRAVTAVPTLLLIITGNFLLLSLVPGDAADAALALAGGGDAGLLADLRQQWQLGEPLWLRWLHYLGRVLLLDLGWSISQRAPVLPLLLERLGLTLSLLLASLLIATSCGILGGILAGSRPDGGRDRLLSGAAALLLATPSFGLGLLLLSIFAVQLGWLPLGGVERSSVGGWLMSLILPAITLAALYLAQYLRLMRSGMIAIAGEDFLRTARAKGLPPWRITLAHAARNALVPVVAMIGVQFAAQLGGSVVVESVFSLPGLGRLAFEAVLQRDVELLLGLILLTAMLVLVAQALLDVVQLALDPRQGQDHGA